MRILAIDTSTEVCSISLAEDMRIAASYMTRGGRTHSERLLPAIEMLLSQLVWNFDSLGLMAVINGPGSFTGLRIGISVVKGLALAFDCPVVAASALEIASLQTRGDGLLCPAMDARRGEIFACLYERNGGKLRELLPPQSVKPSQFRQSFPDAPIRFFGPGAGLYFDVLKLNEDDVLVFQDFALAETLVKSSMKKFISGDFIRGTDLRAAYLRPSDAEANGPSPNPLSKKNSHP